MSVRGDFDALARLRRDLRALASPGFRRDVRVRLAETAAAELGAGIAAGRDPYGAPWPARRNPGDGHPLLRDTGRMLGSLRVRPTAGGIEVTSGVSYAGAHQYGHTASPRTQVNAHGANGRFQARGAAKRKKTGAVRVSFATRGGVTLPRRQFLPEAETGGLGPIWDAAFERAADAMLRVHFGI